MITKSRARFGVSRELEGLDPGRGDLGVDSKIAEKCTGFRVSVGVGLGHVWVEVESRSRRGRSRVDRTESGDFALFHDPLHHALLPVLLDALRVRLSPRADGLALLFWVRVGHGFSLLVVSEIQSARFCTRGW